MASLSGKFIKAGECRLAWRTRLWLANNDDGSSVDHWVNRTLFLLFSSTTLLNIYISSDLFAAVTRLFQ
jgi:hypothetical protein